MHTVVKIVAIDNVLADHPVLRTIFSFIVLLFFFWTGFLCVYNPARVRDMYLRSLNLNADFDILDPRTFIQRPPPLYIVRGFGIAILLVAGTTAFLVSRDFF